MTPTYKLVIRPLPRHDDARGIRRLRALLKALLRGYAFRVIEAAEIQEPANDERKGPANVG